MTHTPGPWKANNIKTDPTDLACAIWDKKGEIPICTGSFSVGKYNEVDAETMHANMQHIVHCVNTHAALVEALEAMVEEKADYMRINHLGDPEATHTIQIARKALAAAKGAS